MKKTILVFLSYALSISVCVHAQTHKSVSFHVLPSVSERIHFALENLKQAAKRNGYVLYSTAKAKYQIFAVNSGSAFADSIVSLYKFQKRPVTNKEHFAIQINKGNILVQGADASGLMYGLMALNDTLKIKHRFPKVTLIEDGPEMVLRGECIGLQKPTYLPGRGVYEYPYTPETFPWLYDKKLWIRVLDSMADNRMNALFLWNGHPFSSLVKVKEYPYALEVDDSTFKKNEEIFGFLTREADKRGIWVIQLFYNIIIPKPFAEHYHLKTQDRNRPIIPVISDYTRKSISAFVQKYPNVGLMVTLGEAMQGVGQDDIDWFTKTIIPGVKDGLSAMGKTEEPPIVLRSHDTDAPGVMKEALPLYKNLYTETKYNGEALTTYTPRGPWAELHRKLAGLGSISIENVHIMANLEPFRYGSPDFIQKSVIAMRDVHKGNGLHLYPQASYWDWPYTADNSGKRLLAIDRDWIWYKAWSRYAWKAKRDRGEEVAYWKAQLSNVYGLSENAAANLLNAYEASGEISPMILRRYGITDGNRQTMTLGMLMTELVNPYRYGLYPLLYNSEGPEGEMLTEYAEKEWKNQHHIGETPVIAMNKMMKYADEAVLSIERASAGVKQNKEEFLRLKNDMYIYQQMAYNYAYKAKAALDVLRYKYSQDINDLEKGYASLAISMKHFDSLVKLTTPAYLYANSMQTQQRRIPVGGDDGKMKTWIELQPVYQEELNTFRYKIDSLKLPQAKKVEAVKFVPADVIWDDKSISSFAYDVAKEVYADTNIYVKNYDESLKDILGIKIPLKNILKGKTSLSFTCKEPVQILVGYFNSSESKFLQKPKLENDASANDRGQAEPKVRNAMVLNGMSVNLDVHAFRFPAGKNVLELPQGMIVLVGAVKNATSIKSFDADITGTGVRKELDWLFEK